MDKKGQKKTQATTTRTWWNKNKSLSILGGIVVMVLIIACGWLIIHPRLYGSYNGYLDGKKEVKLVIQKEKGDTKHGYLQYYASSDAGRAMKRFTTALNKNESTINEFGSELKDSDSLDVKKLMQSDLYKEYLEKEKMPVLVVKHKGSWYLQLDEGKYTEAGFDKADIDDMFNTISKKGKYSEENKISYGFHKLIIGTKKKNNTLYRSNYSPKDPENWTEKKYERETVDNFNEATDKLDELSSLVETMRGFAALNELDNLLDALGDEDTNADADTKADSNSISDDDTEDVNYGPAFQHQHLVLE
ncbi:hypothetical protein [Limosilactobacillus agrestis]|uniref:hypothetical protein n=1 Tax=Limosilactobacillus agrestis TaxID=2759748 RepID=UPI001E4C5BC1|nr:hypothetical protein [Limosilactobacillus agrestis]MCD7112336.1 hypothetical protein [Limosilactobacillus agrestis]